MRKGIFETRCFGLLVEGCLDCFSYKLEIEMGCTPSTQNNSQKDPGHGYQLSSRKIQEPDYDLDVIEMYNLALAMKHRQPTLSI